MAKLPKYYKIHTDGHTVELEPIYADLVPVVLCKDCKKSYKKNKESKFPFVWCNKWDNIMRYCDFCAYGEQKDGDQL